MAVLAFSIGWVVVSGIAAYYYRYRPDNNRAAVDPLDSLHHIFMEESDNAHRLELQDWDEGFKRITGKEPFPKKTIVQGAYNPFGLNGLATLSAQQRAVQGVLMQQQSRLQRLERLEQQALGMSNIWGGFPFR